LQVLGGRRQEPWPTFDLADETGEKVIPHVCAKPEEAYLIKVTNSSQRHIACAVTVDGENALLKDGSLIVAPGDARELPGFLVSKNFIGKEYVKEYRNFTFGKPTVVESNAAGPAEPEINYTSYGRIVCEVFEAVLDEEIDSDQELRGQSTHYRGAGLNGSFEDRKVPEGKKKHFIYSSVTIQGARSSISNSTRGRWWVRGDRRIRTLEVRYREPHALMLLGVDHRSLGVTQCKDEARDGLKDEKKEEEAEEKCKFGDRLDDKIETCDLTEEDGGVAPVWTVEEAPPRAQPVDIVS